MQFCNQLKKLTGDARAQPECNVATCCDELCTIAAADQCLFLPVAYGPRALLMSRLVIALDLRDTGLPVHITDEDFREMTRDGRFCNADGSMGREQVRATQDEYMGRDIHEQIFF